MPVAPFKIAFGAGGLRIPLVAHIPHAKTRISPYVREQILLDDAGLEREIVRLTDWHVATNSRTPLSSEPTSRSRIRTSAHLTRVARIHTGNALADELKRAL